MRRKNASPRPENFLTASTIPLSHDMAPSPPGKISRAFASDPDQPLLLSLEIYDAETKRAQKTAIFQRRTLERHKPAEHVETAAEALAISLNETGRIHWPLMEKLTGPCPEAIAARAGRPGLPQSRGRMGDRRPLSERRCARETQNRRSRSRSRSFLPPQRRGLEGGAARRSPARRHQRPPRLVLDSGERREEIRRRNCSMSPSAPSRSAIPAP